jgi:hypothetical protein
MRTIRSNFGRVRPLESGTLATGFSREPPLPPRLRRITSGLARSVADFSSDTRVRAKASDLAIDGFRVRESAQPQQMRPPGSVNRSTRRARRRVDSRSTHWSRHQSGTSRMLAGHEACSGQPAWPGLWTTPCSAFQDAVSLPVCWSWLISSDPRQGGRGRSAWWAARSSGRPTRRRGHRNKCPVQVWSRALYTGCGNRCGQCIGRPGIDAIYQGEW